jgi:hypothetical protein
MTRQKDLQSQAALFPSPLWWKGATAVGALALALAVLAVYIRMQIVHVEILFPSTAAHVNSTAIVRGIAENIGASRTVWVAMKSEEGNYYFHASAARTTEGTNEWSSEGCIGPVDDFDKEFEIEAVVADKEAQVFLREKGQTMCRESAAALPAGVRVLAVVNVTRSRKWTNVPR